MKSHFLSVLFYPCLLSLVLAAPLNQPDQSQIEKMQIQLSKSRPSDFIQAVSSNRWLAPAIWSKWYVDNVGDNDVHANLVRNRIFGRAFAVRIDDWAADMLDATSKQSATDSATLLDVADWLASVEGYGNLLLASRCRDIAAVGIGKLVVDLSAPLESVSSLVKRLDAPWTGPVVRADVLNTEAGTNLFNVSGIPVAEAEKRLQEIWRNGQLLRLKYSNPAAKAAFQGQTNAGFEVLSSMVQQKRFQPDEAVIFLQKLPFFADDPYSSILRPVTLLNMWDAKRHEKLVVGFDLQNEAKLKALLAFRSVVGVFPASQDEFKSAWVSHITGSDHRINKEKYHIFASAWQAYKEIKSGEFVDDDTREKRLNAQLTAKPYPNAR